MKKAILVASVAVIALGGGAFAADLPSRVEAPAPFIQQPPVFTWTGFYAGVNAGIGFNAGRDRRSSLTVLPGGFTTPPGAPPGFTQGSIVYGDNRDDAVFTGGGQIGYNFQFVNNFVLGAEADLQFLGFDDDMSAAVAVAGFPASFTPARRGTQGLDWFGTVRLRAGYAFDRTLIYATGGLAYGKGDATRFEATNGIGGFFEDRNVAFGYTLGAGVEYAVTNNLIVGLEGLYVALDRDTSVTNFAGTYQPGGAGTQVFPVAAASASGNDNVEFGVVRARVNYKF